MPALKNFPVPFIPTSPAIQDMETALLYPGMGLLEGINVNEGRGTNSSFKIVGAPWIDAQQLNKNFTSLQLTGIKSLAVSYVPAYGMYANENCNGLGFSVTDFNRFQPVQAGLKLLQLIISLYPEECKERLYPTVANPSGGGHLDKLTGVYQCFEKIKNGDLPSTELQQKDPITTGWRELIQPHLLY